MLFDLLIQLQSARLHEQPSTKQSNVIRCAIRRLRESLMSGRKTTESKPVTNDVSRDLALSFLLNRNDNEPF